MRHNLTFYADVRQHRIVDGLRGPVALARAYRIDRVSFVKAFRVARERLAREVRRDSLVPCRADHPNVVWAGVVRLSGPKVGRRLETETRIRTYHFRPAFRRHTQ